jgi:hypothetical protein
VLRAAEELKKEVYKVDLRLVENLPHHEALEAYTRADIAVDQLLTGWYGVFAIERMALSSPVCVYIKDDLMISADPSRIKQRLADFVCKRMVKDVYRW